VPSSSGKTTIIASTAVNVSAPDREEVRLGLNVYKKQSDSARAVREGLQGQGTR
jgi:hypothetical protein